jgi:hypothetical protein
MAIAAPALAGIQYMGLARGARSCRDAVLRLLQGGCHVDKARIVTADEEHALVLTVDDADTIAIKTGLGPGGGSESRGLRAQTLRLLRAHGTEIDEFAVDVGFLRRVEASALTRQDLDDLDDALPLRPVRWTAYLDDSAVEAAALPHTLPLGLIDGRLMDLALRFHEAPDRAVAGALRRVEAVAKDPSVKADQAGILAALRLLERLPCPQAGVSERARLCSEFLYLNHLMRLLCPST